MPEQDASAREVQHPEKVPGRGIPERVTVDFLAAQPTT
jgi:hypothetical protein